MEYVDVCYQSDLDCILCICYSSFCACVRSNLRNALALFLENATFCVLSIAIKGFSCPIWHKPMPALHLKDAGIAHPDGSYREIFTEEELCEDGVTA